MAAPGKLNSYEHIEREGLWYAVQPGEEPDLTQPGQLSRTASQFALRFKLTGVLPPENSSAHPDYVARHEAREQRAATVTETAAGTVRLFKNIELTRHQTRAAPGQTVWWCNLCMVLFAADGKARPDKCPKGHPADLEGIHN